MSEQADRPESVIAKPQPGLHFVVDVARDAASLRFPLLDRDGVEGRALTIAWQQWAVETLLLQAKGYAYDHKIGIFLTDDATAVACDPLSAPQGQWRVDAPGREALLQLFNDDPVEIVPTYDVSPCPLFLPATLRLLPDDLTVRIRYPWGRMYEASVSAADAVEVFEETVSRQAEGWLVIGEAAQILDAAGRGLAARWREKLQTAAQADVLPMHEPKSRERIAYGSTLRVSDSRRVSAFADWVHVDDLNKWLHTHEPRLPYRFGVPAAARSMGAPVLQAHSVGKAPDTSRAAVEGLDIEASMDERWIGGRKLWLLSEALGVLVAMPGIGLTMEALEGRVVRAAAARPPKIVFRDPKDGDERPGDQLSGFLDDWLFASDMNSWLQAEMFAETYRLPPDGAAPSNRPAHEGTEARQSRRLDRLKALGGDRVLKHGGGWKASGKHGALAQLAREEARAGRQYSNDRDVARDVDAEADRRRIARAMPRA